MLVIGIHLCDWNLLIFIFFLVMIIDQSPVTNKFISVPKEMGSLNCAAFIAGVVKGVLDATNFVCYF